MTNMWLEYIVIFFAGLYVGSLANIGIIRSLESRALWEHSKCTCCKVKLKWTDMIPVLSYLLLKGKCRYCKTRLSCQYPIVELSYAVIFVAIYEYTGFNIEFLLYGSFAFFTLMIAVTDLLTHDVYWWMVLAGFCFAVPCLLYLGQLLQGIYGLAAGSIICCLFIAGAVIHQRWLKQPISFGKIFQEMFGFGDVLFILFISVVVGPVSSISVILCSGLLLLITVLVTRRKALPFCPILGAALIVDFYLPGGFLGTYITVIELAGKGWG